MFGKQQLNQPTHLFCLRHPKKVIKYIDIGTDIFRDLSERLICDDCYAIRAKDKKRAEDLQPIVTKEFSDHHAAVITNQAVYKPLSTYQLPKTMDFKNCELEHVILEGNSRGYAPRVIHYLDNLKILAVGSESGQITLWKMDDVPQVYHIWQEKNTIRVISSLNYGGKMYLLVAVDKNVLVYLLKNGMPTLETTLPGATFVNHIVSDLQNNKLYILYWFSSIIEYDLRSNFKNFQMINTDLFGMKPPNATLELLDDGTIAVEHGGGLSMLIPNTVMVTHCPTYNRTAYGMAYLKHRREFLLRVTSSETYVINRQSLSFTAKFRTAMDGMNFPGFKFMPNEDDTQVCTNSNENSVYIYEDNGIFRKGLEGYISQSSGIEYCADIKKFIVGDEKMGILLVFRSKIPQTSKISHIIKIPQANHMKDLSLPNPIILTKPNAVTSTSTQPLTIPDSPQLMQAVNRQPFIISTTRSRSRTNSRDHSPVDRSENPTSIDLNEGKEEEKVRDIIPVREIDENQNEAVSIRKMNYKKFSIVMKLKHMPKAVRKEEKDTIAYVKLPVKTRGKALKVQHKKYDDEDIEERSY